VQPLPDSPSSEPKLIWGVLFSAIFHCILIVILIGVPSFSTPKRTYFSSAYMVNLVDAPRAKPAGASRGAKGAGSGGGKVVVKEEPAKPEKTNTKKKTETKAAPKKQPEKAKEVNKTSQKKGTTLVEEDANKKKSSAAKSVAKTSTADSTESAYSQALNKIKQKVEKQRKQEEIARIRDKIAGQGIGGGGGGGFPAGAASGGGVGGGIPSGQGTVAQLPINYQLYYQIIEEKIKRNWNLALPRGVMEDMRAMEVVLSITIKADGTITDLAFEKKSGNIYLDDSAFRAVKKSSPLPPFSEYNIREPFFETGIVFPVGELL